MNRIILIGAFLVLGTVAFLSLTAKNKDVKTVPVPYYVHSHQASQPKALWQEPPAVDQIKKDLDGKAVQIAGSSHTFAAPEVNYVSILNVNGDDKTLVVDVQINSDVTLVQKAGALGLRKNYTHENVSGSVRIYYDRQGDVWVYRMVENIDTTKKLIPKIN
jgi:hypothetical protein